jgi:hypothetical protein
MKFLALGTVVIVIKITKLHLFILLNKIPYAEEAPVLAFRLIRASWDQLNDVSRSYLCNNYHRFIERHRFFLTVFSFSFLYQSHIKGSY